MTIKRQLRVIVVATAPASLGWDSVPVSYVVPPSRSSGLAFTFHVAWFAAFPVPVEGCCVTGYVVLGREKDIQNEGFRLKQRRKRK